MVGWVVKDLNGRFVACFKVLTAAFRLERPEAGHPAEIRKETPP